MRKFLKTCAVSTATIAKTHLLIDLDRVDVAHRVLAEEVKGDLRRRREGDMLAAEGTAAHSVRLVVALFVAGTKSEAIDEVKRGRTLTRGHHLVGEILLVVLADAVDVLLRRVSG